MSNAPYSQYKVKPNVLVLAVKEGKKTSKEFALSPSGEAKVGMQTIFRIMRIWLRL
jgi:hypothetical protein